MNIFEKIANFFEPIAESLPFLSPLTDPLMILFICIGLVIAVLYYITGSWFGNRHHHDDYHDGYDDGYHDR